MTPTAEQQAIIEAVRTTTDNIIVTAYAGAAKTTTLVLICEALAGTPVLSLAFNKRIAEEMEKRLPGHVASSTLNSQGHRIWGSACAKRLKLDSQKSGAILKSIISDYKKSDADSVWKEFPEIIRAVSAAKAAGYIPDGKWSHAKSLTTFEEFYDALDDPINNHHLIDQILNESITQSYAGTIDFDDQIYMPTLFGGTFPRFPVVCVDEAQDLSPLNHEMLRKFVSKRLIVVGDPYQSIYGFRGAAQDGMASLKSTFNMKEFKLSISFRCPKSVVRVARSRVPDMQWSAAAADGVVSHLDRWSEANVPDGSAVICRNNAPLFRLALNLIRRGRGIQLIGSDIGGRLVKILKKLGSEAMTQSEVLNAIDQWREAQVKKKGRETGAISDTTECLIVFALAGPNLSAAIAHAEHIFAAKGPVLLMSGHKAKGLEFDHVFFLDPFRIREGDQELNIAYVIQTRAKQSLTHVDMNNFF